MKIDCLSVRDGYAKWAQTYDQENNPLIRLEERALDGLVQDVPAVVLDAACGTGRHALRFAATGSRVLGVDASPEMLARARAKANALRLSHVQFVRGVVDEGLPCAHGQSIWRCVRWLFAIFVGCELRSPPYAERSNPVGTC